MERIYKLANLYSASLRAIYLIHQFSHWTTKGLGFYGDHLLFERLYKSAADNADLAAEKFIGLFGEDAMDYALQQEYIAKMLTKYQDHAMEKLMLGLSVEKDFLAFSEQVYAEMEKEGSLSLGLDDMLMSIASDREGACYLLQQALDKQGNHDE